MNFMPIILDIETSGLDFVKCGVWQIGAYDIMSGKKFIEESRIDYKDRVEKGALRVIGKTEAELKNPKKQSQKKLLENFFNWVKERPMKNFLCQNPSFDVTFLEIKANKYGLKLPSHYRCFDLHNIAQKTYFDINKKFLIKEDHSDMGLTNILKLCGLEDNRQAHNALEDCKLTGECFYRLIQGKNLFPEYFQYKIPKELKK